jgi:hypothetical protein
MLHNLPPFGGLVVLHNALVRSQISFEYFLIYQNNFVSLSVIVV